jgi:hypothetical protein
LAGTWPTFRQESPEAVKEHPDLRQAAAGPGQLLDHALRLPGRPRRVLQEVVRQGAGVGRQVALGAVELDPPQGLDPACEVLVEVALHSAAAQVGQAGDLGVRQAAALEPEDLHLLLDAGVGVVEPLVPQGGHIRVGEGELAHGWPRPESGELTGDGVAIIHTSGKRQLWPVAA